MMNSKTISPSQNTYGGQLSGQTMHRSSRVHPNQACQSKSPAPRTSRRRDAVQRFLASKIGNGIVRHSGSSLRQPNSLNGVKFSPTTSFRPRPPSSSQRYRSNVPQHTVADHPDVIHAPYTDDNMVPMSQLTYSTIHSNSNSNDDGRGICLNHSQASNAYTASDHRQSVHAHPPPLSHLEDQEYSFPPLTQNSQSSLSYKDRRASHFSSSQPPSRRGFPTSSSQSRDVDVLHQRPHSAVSNVRDQAAIVLRRCKTPPPSSSSSLSPSLRRPLQTLRGNSTDRQSADRRPLHPAAGQSTRIAPVVRKVGPLSSLGGTKRFLTYTSGLFQNRSVPGSSEGSARQPTSSASVAASNKSASANKRPSEPSPPTAPTIKAETRSGLHDGSIHNELDQLKSEHRQQLQDTYKELLKELNDHVAKAKSEAGTYLEEKAEAIKKNLASDSDDRKREYDSILTASKEQSQRSLQDLRQQQISKLQSASNEQRDECIATIKESAQGHVDALAKAVLAGTDALARTSQLLLADLTIKMKQPIKSIVEVMFGDVAKKWTQRRPPGCVTSDRPAVALPRPPAVIHAPQAALATAGTETSEAPPSTPNDACGTTLVCQGQPCKPKDTAEVETDQPEKPSRTAGTAALPSPSTGGARRPRISANQTSCSKRITRSQTLAAQNRRTARESTQGSCGKEPRATVAETAGKRTNASSRQNLASNHRVDEDLPKNANGTNTTGAGQPKPNQPDQVTELRARIRGRHAERNNANASAGNCISKSNEQRTGVLQTQLSTKTEPCADPRPSQHSCPQTVPHPSGSPCSEHNDGMRQPGREQPGIVCASPRVSSVPNPQLLEHSNRYRPFAVREIAFDQNADVCVSPLKESFSPVRDGRAAAKAEARSKKASIFRRKRALVMPQPTAMTTSNGGKRQKQSAPATKSAKTDGKLSPADPPRRSRETAGTPFAGSRTRRNRKRNGSASSSLRNRSSKISKFFGDGDDVFNFLG